MRMDDATRAQVLAADPAQSTWLSANAGSGKTRVLIDRVARLLLGGTEPQKILCLTYTKAAASEMQNRLFQRLGKWAMLEEEKLRQELRDLGAEGPISADTLARARRLFARAIETPGGLKIQTIHSFCASLLRRFPVEARVSPDFTELDDRAAQLLRQEIVEGLAAGEDVAAVDALARLSPGDDLGKVLADIAAQGTAFDGGLTRGAALGLMGLPADYDEAALLAGVFLGGEAELMAALVPLLRASSSSDVKLAAALSALNLSAPGLDPLAMLEDQLLFGSKAAAPFAAKIGKVPTLAVQKTAAPFMPRLEALMRRVEAGRGQRLALHAAEKTLALHRFAHAFLPRYRARKAAQGYLDFDDLITRAAALLSDKSVAAWVLYRLDGGIDHILVDEAQDTSPGQWRVIEALAEEFTAGQGARGQDRRIFVVGDVKQSIYSFQGADLQTFGRMREAFEERHLGAGAPFLRQELAHSFRSSDAILRVVDATFHDGVNRGLGGRPNHLAFHIDMPGRVDLWPPIVAAGAPEPEEWDNPVDLLPETHHTVILAEKIATEIRAMIDQGVQINLTGTARPVDEGDFLILVRRRSPLFHETIRACKAAGLAIAGADRLLLTAELAVKDLTALLAFLATPEDDLSLAAVLRSPLFGWDEGALYRLAQGRGGKTYLWQALRAKAADFPETLAVLNDLRDQADYLRPYDLIERVLTRHDGRRKLLSRLGPEAEDGIDAFLAQALAYERASVPSLTGFLVWMEGGEVEVKRRLDASQRAIRVMTVHGAKGLEAPIVILPDTAKRDKRDRGTFVTPEGLPALWKTARDESPPVVADELAARAARDGEESMRLLYVAMTRAECWLIVAAAGEVGRGADSWYGLVADGLTHAGGAGGRLQYGDWPEALGHAAEPRAAGATTLPDWANAPAARPEAVLAALSPSQLGGAKALPGETGQDEEAAKRRGTALHLLLEHLPMFDRADWRAVADSLLVEGAESAETDTVFDEATRVLTAPALAHLFAPGALAEVELTAPLPEFGGQLMQGTIDRLIFAPGRVLAVDFKSNATLPTSAAEVPDGILRQMGAYAAMLGQLYPDRTIETAIVWTRTASLMPLPLNMVRGAVARTTLP